MTTPTDTCRCGFVQGERVEMISGFSHELIRGTVELWHAGCGHIVTWDDLPTATALPNPNVCPSGTFGVEVGFKVAVAFVCPFCSEKRPVYVGGFENQPAILHQEPRCKEFNDLEMVDFLTAARTKMEAKKSS